MLKKYIKPLYVMKKIFSRLVCAALVLACASPLFSAAQPADKRAGEWGGLMETTGLPILFHITGDSAAAQPSTWDSPLERRMGQPCKVLFKGDSLRLTVGFMAFYRGKYQPATDSISGVWEQPGQQLVLNLRRMRRPQTPRPPFPYLSDSVEYDNADRTVHLGATLTRPQPFGSGKATGKSSGSHGAHKYPAVILITGSGQQDRDETILNHRPFAIIADYLTRRGIAVLRVDDRGMGKSTGDLKDATSASFAGDVIAGIRYLATRNDIDTTQIGLIGHSEGGFIAPIVYTRWPHLKFIIMLAGPGIPGSEIILRQQTDPVRGMGPAAYAAYYSLDKDKLKILNDYYGQPDSLTLRALKAEYTRWKSGLPDSISVRLHAKNSTADQYAAQVSLELKPWLRYFYKTDPAIFLQQVKCPVLALDGSKDTQVDPGQNIPAIRNALLKGGNTHVTTQVFPGLNHLFQHCATGQFSEYALIEESFAPEVLQVMGDWIAQIR